ncbi:BQ5605_C013g07228 [Microbotryum silenes-dioicae]|uniref:BQ5605_C013g07228 protein n=1 Tax=Microbotryum silenes-dioicae TaxID=796604 RepID=A0A2X0NVG4_9BASI|nr:BQ5605_C013g07228 [Microbotryum silenes-dioicae]
MVAIPEGRALVHRSLPVEQEHVVEMMTNEEHRQVHANLQIIIGYQWIVLGVIGVLMLRHLIYTVKRRHRAWRLALHKIRAMNDEIRGFHRLEPPPRTRNLVEHFEALLLTPLASKWWLGLANPLQVGLIVLLLVVNTVSVLVISIDWRQANDAHWNAIHVVALRCGWLSLAQLPAIVALTGRNSLVQLVTGIQYQHLRFAHRAFAWWMVLFGALHTIEASIATNKWFGREGVERLYRNNYLGITGLVIVGGCFLLVFFSLPAIRRRCYELFLFMHIAGAGLILGGLAYHISSSKVLLWVAIGLWGVERLLRLCKLVSIRLLTRLQLRPPVVKASATLIEGAVVLRVPFHGTWEAGQHAYIGIWDKAFASQPQVYGQLHPFSIANVPRSGTLDEWEETQLAKYKGVRQAGHTPTAHEMLFIIRTREGMTRIVADRLAQSPTASMELMVSVEGPYGGAVDTEEFQEILFLAGGTGISHIMSMLEDVIHKARVSYSKARVIRLIWTVQSVEQSIWTLSSLLESAKEAFEADVELRLELYVTRTPSGTRVPSEHETIHSSNSSSSTTMTKSSREKDLPLPPPLTALIARTGIISTSAAAAAAVTSPELDELMETSPMADALTVSAGRPYWPGLLPSFVGGAEGKSLVVACGPGTMGQEVRWEVSKLAREYPVSLDVALFEC